MRKLKQASIVLLVCSTLLMAAFLIYEHLTLDSTPPVISCPTEEILVSTQDPEQVLLADVTARDDRCGDVSDAVVVEKLSAMDSDGTRTITYAVIDADGNVGRAQRTLRYTDYDHPRMQMTAPLRYPLSEGVSDILSPVHAFSALDGDLTGKLKFLQKDSIRYQAAGRYPIEIRITDSAGVTEVLPIDLEFYAKESELLRLELSSYLVYLEAGTPFLPNAYLKTPVPEGSIQADYDPDMIYTPGVYQVDYQLEQDGRIGRSRLVVVVEEKEDAA